MTVSVALHRVLWSCNQWPGGRHWYASIGLLNADGEGYEWRIERKPKFTNPESALKWIEREFAKLGQGYQLFDYMELVEGVAAMREDILRRAGAPHEEP